jgi:hypothetical protein
LARSSSDVVALVEPLELWVVGVIVASLCTGDRGRHEVVDGVGGESVARGVVRVDAEIGRAPHDGKG